jgi:DNA modification methylase
MIVQKDSLKFLQEQKDFAFDINYSDPPYALGSEIYIRPDGKFDYKKATDFMNKWDMPTGEYWEKWFEESFRTLKHGGYCVMFGMDRQLPMFQYYAIKSGFQVRQSMYWYFIQNFPKSSNLSDNIDKSFKVKRTVVGTKKGMGKQNPEFGGKNQGRKQNYIKPEYDLTYPTHDLAKKYEGFRYSISPLKQTCETIMIFQKPYKTGSCLHDTLAYENGDDTCACFAWNIDGGRVPTDDIINPTTAPDFKDVGRISKEVIGIDKLSFGQVNDAKRINYEQNLQGRYPSQTFCDSGTAERLDEQSGISKGSDAKRTRNKTSDSFGMPNDNTPEYSDTGGCSKILHKCDYENGEMDLYVYAPKVSKNERNAGCEEFEDKVGGSLNFRNPSATGRSEDSPSVQSMGGLTMPSKNNHPTLKPISLSYRVLKLFKTPNPQKIVYTFAGVQSEVIGGYKAGFTDFSGCELNAEYVDIGNVRFEHWKDKPFDEKGKVVEPKKETKAKNEEKPKKKPNEQLKLL